MILRLGYLMQGVIKKIGEISSATIKLFADNANYKTDTELLFADNDSSV